MGSPVPCCKVFAWPIVFILVFILFFLSFQLHRRSLEGSSCVHQLVVSYVKRLAAFLLVLKIYKNMPAKQRNLPSKDPETDVPRVPPYGPVLGAPDWSNRSRAHRFSIFLLRNATEKVINGSSSRLSSLLFYAIFSLIRLFNLKQAQAQGTGSYPFRMASALWGCFLICLILFSVSSKIAVSSNAHDRIFPTGIWAFHTGCRDLWFSLPSR